MKGMKGVLVATMASVVALFNGSLSAAIADGPGVTLELKLPDKVVCGTKTVLPVRVGNAIGEAVEIGSLTASRHRMGEEINPLNGEVRPISEDLPAAIITTPKAGWIVADSMVEATFPIPTEDGVYSDVFTVRWRRAGTEPWLFTDTFLKFEVVDGCVEVLTEEEYERQTNSYSLIPFVRYGKEVLELAVEGGGTFDGSEEPLPEVAGIEAVDATETTVVVDGAPYQFQDEAYEPFSDDLFDEDAEVPGGGGGPKAPESVLALQYCVRVRYHQDAFQVPTDEENLVGMRWWLPKKRIDNPYPEPDEFTKMNFLGLKVELWDRDSSNDDYITSAVLNYTANGQYFCINFNWDQAAQGENYPDPYIKTYYQVTKPRTGIWFSKWGILCTDSCGTCASKPVMSWRNEYYPDLGQSVSTVYETTFFTQSADPTTPDQVAITSSSQAIQMAYMQKFFEVWNEYEMTGNIHAKWSEEGILSSVDGTCINLARYYEQGANDVFWHRRWDGPVHEAGHSYQDQLLGVNSLGSCPQEHHGWCSYNDHCATNEGWAEFVAMRAWYPDDSDESEPIYYTTSYQYGIEPGGYELPHSPFSEEWCGEYACPAAAVGTTLWHNCYSMNEMMAARAFWDMMDSNPDGGDAAIDSVLWPYLADVWDLFPAGTGNHQANESSPYLNMRDYLYNAYGLGAEPYSDITHAMENNSMTSQDPD